MRDKERVAAPYDIEANNTGNSRNLRVLGQMEVR